MAEEPEELQDDNTVEESSSGPGLMDKLSNIELLLEENQRGFLIGSGVLALVVVVLVYVFMKYLPEQNLKAQNDIYMAQFAFAKDSFAVALNGNTNFKGFADVADKYSWTSTGHLANYYAGICCLNLKRYDEAIKYLDKFSTSDAVIGAQRLGLIGDAYAEKGNMADAIKYYQKAADFSDNDKFTPYFLMKAGLANESQKNNS
ncbi:MAG TPA: tetratricopeptide repeat protein, partial [Chitinophagales bacterium]|nr:tetratricopeptide repeat protein [Chitinophagales bacterium]